MKLPGNKVDCFKYVWYDLDGSALLLKFWASFRIFFFYYINRPYFSRPRKYRRLFPEPAYWPRRSRGQYGEGNNQAGIFEAEGNKSLIPGRLVRSPLTCPSTRKVRDESVVSLCSECCNASTGSPWLSGSKWFDRLFSTCNRQLADNPGW